ncbi:MAG: hypothetical protein EA342_03245 [Leptolyngbya sp. LCM1.Bin17]|uniref:hypothetical protein n=1 Tax=Nodosilinea sp. P-1105 TaxID=2546229 RepID=UPI00140027C9|nr:hypothetical protein [Nodosilinea sp. P-1105]NMF86353.1 hypothetical protein [Nodosilinea sp. P-1105]TVP69536.1 MAG: hypothetical protein EA342_03245 [Leptolyngbya sp. LCM1.Bin17]
MDDETVVQISAMTGWIIGVSHSKNRGYQCWIVNPALDVLSDGTFYTTSSAAMSAGRAFVERFG